METRNPGTHLRQNLAPPRSVDGCVAGPEEKEKQKMKTRYGGVEAERRREGMSHKETKFRTNLWQNLASAPSVDCRVAGPAEGVEAVRGADCARVVRELLLLLAPLAPLLAQAQRVVLERVVSLRETPEGNNKQTLLVLLQRR